MPGAQRLLEDPSSALEVAVGQEHFRNGEVYDDHSIMGDYYKEGMTEATAKARHGERLAAIIGPAVDKNLTSRMR
jgi:hypothetical protein